MTVAMRAASQRRFLAFSRAPELQGDALTRSPHPFDAPRSGLSLVPERSNKLFVVVHSASTLRLPLQRRSPRSVHDLQIPIARA
jgi:hypothetical protein